MHSTPPLGGGGSRYCNPVWLKKTRMMGLPNGEKNFEDMYNRLDRIPACDRQTDGRTYTSCHGIVRTMHTRRAVKINTVIHGPQLLDQVLENRSGVIC